MIESGKFYSISNEDYHNGIGKDWESKSSLVRILKSPRNYRYHKDNPESLDVFDIKAEKYHTGTSIHTYFLEPSKFKEEIYVMPDERRSKATTEYVRSSGKTPIKTAFYQEILEMEKALTSGYYEVARKLLQNPDNFIEQSGFYQDTETGIKLKTRPDFIAPNKVIWDLKTHAGLKSFIATAIDLDYDMQAALAIEVVSAITGIEHNKVGYIVVEKSQPYEWAVWLADDDYLKSGREKLDKAMGILSKCLEKNEWPGVPDAVQILSPPGWRLNQIAERGYL